MGTWDHSRQPSSDKPPEELSGKGDTFTDPTIVEGEALVVDGTSNGAADFGIANQLADNDVLAAITPSVTSDTLASIEHALDQLTSATDLFDVPALDFDGASDS